MASYSPPSTGVCDVHVPGPRTGDRPLAAPAVPSGPAPKRWISRGSAEYRRVGWALFLAGFACYSLIYCVQPLLPAFAKAYGIGPAKSSLALSVTTGLIALSTLLASAFSQALGRRGLIFCCMAAASGLSVLCAVTPSWQGLLYSRAMQGVMLGGVPVVAMAYLAEEIDPDHLGEAMGLYVGGTAFGAMMGRVGMGLVTEVTSWQAALAVLGACCLASTVGFFLLLPKSRNFARRPGLDLRFHVAAWRAHLADPRLLRLYGIGFTLTSIFVTLFNYATFRLCAAPYGLDQTEISMIFLSYTLGIFSSSAGGKLSDRFGPKALLLSGFALLLAGIACTLASSLFMIFVGIAFVTAGFFVAHAVASGSVSPLAGTTKGHATALYLLFYYIGSSVVGSLGGWFWENGGWTAIATLTGALALFGVALTLANPRQARQDKQ